MIDLEQERILHFERFHQSLFRLHPKRIVPHRQHGADLLACGIADGTRGADSDHDRAVGPPDFPRRLDHRFPPLDGTRQRQFIRRVWQIVHCEEFVVVRVFVGRHIEIGAAVNLFGCPVDADNASVGIGHDDALAELVQNHRLEAFNRTQHSLSLYQNATDRRGIVHDIRYR